MRCPMRMTTRVMPVLAVLAAFVLPAAADETGPGAPHATGVQNAITRIQNATARHIQILTDRPAKVRPQAQSGIQPAIESAAQGPRPGRQAGSAGPTRQTGTSRAAGDSRPPGPAVPRIAGPRAE